MLSKGFQKLLDRIRMQPDSSKLVNRYLVLAAELDSLEQKNAVMELAKTFLENNPLRALKVVKMLNDSFKDDHDVLELVRKCMLGLGRLGKAEVILHRMKTVSNRSRHPVTQEENNDQEFQKVLEHPQPSLAETIVFPQVPEPPGAPRSLASRQAKTVQLPPLVGSRNEVKKQPQQGASDSEAPARYKPHPKNNQVNASQSLADLLQQKSKNFRAEQLKVLPNSTMIAINGIPEVHESVYKDLEMFVKKHQKSLGLIEDFFAGLWMSKLSKDVVRLMDSQNLSQKSLGLFGIYLDHLIVSCSPIIAYRKILEVLLSEPSIDWCQVAFPRLQQVYFRQHWLPLKWQEDQGYRELLLELKKRPRPKFEALVA